MIFRRSIFFRIIVSLLVSIPWGIIIGFLAYLLLFSSTKIELLPCLLFSGLLVFITEFLLSRQERLIISKQGVEYHSLYYQVRSSWENISHVAANRFSPLDRDCLFLKESGISFSKVWAIQMTFFCFANPNIGRSIPLGRFVFGDWRKSKIGSEIQKYAQHLLDKRPKTGST